MPQNQGPVVSFKGKPAAVAFVTRELFRRRPGYRALFRNSLPDGDICVRVVLDRRPDDAVMACVLAQGGLVEVCSTPLGDLLSAKLCIQNLQC